MEIPSGGSFESFRVFDLLHDTTKRERRGLALRRAYRTLAPFELVRDSRRCYAPPATDMIWMLASPGFWKGTACTRWDERSIGWKRGLERCPCRLSRLEI